jgi:hypothetical protein
MLRPAAWQATAPVSGRQPSWRSPPQPARLLWDGKCAEMGDASIAEVLYMAAGLCTHSRIFPTILHVGLLSTILPNNARFSVVSQHGDEKEVMMPTQVSHPPRLSAGPYISTEASGSDGTQTTETATEARLLSKRSRGSCRCLMAPMTVTDAS